MKPVRSTKRTTKTPTVQSAPAKATPPVASSVPNGDAKSETTFKASTSTVPSVAAKQTQPTASATSETTIKAKIDVGFGNRLFVRGQGAGLSWERGTPLTCVDGQTWQWKVAAADKLTFKLLLNDSVWQQGENLVAAPGQRVEISPSF